VDPCGPMSLTQFGSTASQGTWGAAPATLDDIPALDGFGLALLSLLLVGVALFVLKSTG
jgi:hypothetical protein